MTQITPSSPPRARAPRRLAAALVSIPLVTIPLASIPLAASAAVTFTPAPLAFGQVALTEAKTRNATFENATDFALGITGATLQGANAADYSLSHNCPTPLLAGRSCRFRVNFRPGALTPSVASLAVTTDHPAYPALSLRLQGNGSPGVLNDTGIQTCSDATTNRLPCPVAGFPGQDAEFGRDAQARTDGDANGQAGFNFTKLDGKGNPLPASATNWRCVRDNVTGLEWEVKPRGDAIIGNQGRHDADDRFTWYNTDATDNNGFAGYPNQGATCGGHDPAVRRTWCNTQAFVNRVNAAGWCGAKDWRLPTVGELKGLADLSIRAPGPTLDTAYFRDVIVGQEWYWSSSTPADNAQNAWLMYFGNGYGNYYSSRIYGYPVRLVRGGQ